MTLLFWLAWTKLQTWHPYKIFSISQVTANLNPTENGAWELSTAYLTCSCTPCQKKNIVEKECLYYAHSNVNQHKEAQRCEKRGEKYGVSKMTVKELKHKLSARKMSPYGLKAVLLMWVVTLLQREDSEVINDDMENKKRQRKSTKRVEYWANGCFC